MKIFHALVVQDQLQDQLQCQPQEDQLQDQPQEDQLQDQPQLQDQLEDQTQLQDQLHNQLQDQDQLQIHDQSKYYIPITQDMETEVDISSLIKQNGFNFLETLKLELK